jgi:hypothetical protein
MTAQIAIDFGAVQRDRGVEGALSNFARGEIHTAIVLCATRAATFTSEDVRRELGPSVLSQLQMRPNSLGAAINAAARSHVIEATGQTVKTSHPEGHARRIMVWKLKPRTP